MENLAGTEDLHDLILLHHKTGAYDDTQNCIDYRW